MGGVGSDFVKDALDHAGVVENTGRGLNGGTEIGERAECLGQRSIEPGHGGQLRERPATHAAVEMEIQVGLGQDRQVTPLLGGVRQSIPVDSRRFASRASSDSAYRVRSASAYATVSNDGKGLAGSVHTQSA
jgi:hypothetical protein